MYMFFSGKELHRALVAMLPLLFCILLWGTPSSSAAEKHQHGAHVHGLGQLNVANDDRALLLEFMSPAANIIGFEHTPKNTKEEEAVREATAVLQAGEKLFTISAEAQCTLDKVHVKNSVVEEDHDDVHHTSAKDGEHHDEDHAEDHSAHSEFTGTYHFLCTTPAKLETIDVRLFSYFPGLEELEVQLLTPKGQMALELSPKMHKIIF